MGVCKLKEATEMQEINAANYHLHRDGYLLGCGHCGLIKVLAASIIITLMMETASTSGCWNNPDDSYVHTHCHNNLKSHSPLYAVYS
jgi:hypothetical protein